MLNDTGHTNVFLICDTKLPLCFDPHCPLQWQDRDSQRQFATKELRYGQNREGVTQRGNQGIAGSSTRAPRPGLSLSVGVLSGLRRP